MYGLITEFLDIIRKNNTSKIRHFLATDGLLILLQDNKWK